MNRLKALTAAMLSAAMMVSVAACGTTDTADSGSGDSKTVTTGYDVSSIAKDDELAKLVEKAGGFDLIICGDGSADLYAKQTGVQLAAKLDVPYLSEVVSVEAADGKVVCKRMLASEIETVEVPLPAVIAVSPDVAQPRIAGMKQILAAGKKPQAVEAADAPAAATVETVAVKAPEQADRACKVFEDVNEFVAAVKAAL